MPQDYLLIPKEQMLAFGKLIHELTDLHLTILSGAGTVTLNLEAPFVRDEDGETGEVQLDERHVEPDTALRGANADSKATFHSLDGDKDPVSGKYIIRPGGLSYADVIDREVHKNAFTLDEAWTAIKEKVVTKSQRARESMRRALEGDQRFTKAGKDFYLRREVKAEYDANDALPF